MQDEFDGGMGLPDDELMGESTTTEISGAEVDEGEAGAAPEPSGGRRSSGRLFGDRDRRLGRRRRAIICN